MLDTADAAEFLAVTGAAGTAVHQVRQRRTVPGGLGRGILIEHQHPAVPWGDTQDQVPHHLRIGGDQGADQAAATTGGQVDGMIGVPVAQHRADRPEDLDVVRFATAGILGPQQHRRQERATLRVGADHLEVVRIADHHVRRGGEFGQVLPDIVPLRQARPARPW